MGCTKNALQGRFDGGEFASRQGGRLVVVAGIQQDVGDSIVESLHDREGDLCRILRGTILMRGEAGLILMNTFPMY